MEIHKTLFVLFFKVQGKHSVMNEKGINIKLAKILKTYLYLHTFFLSAELFY